MEKNILKKESVLENIKEKKIDEALKLFFDNKESKTIKVEKNDIELIKALELVKNIATYFLAVENPTGHDSAGAFIEKRNIPGKYENEVPSIADPNFEIKHKVFNEYTKTLVVKQEYKDYKIVIEG